MIFTFFALLTIVCSISGNIIKLNTCNCGGFLKINNFGENSNIKIDKEPLEALFDHPDVVGRRVYVVGNFGESQVLDEIVLRELYTNFDSLKDPECRGPVAYSCIEENTKNPSNNSIELWNDAFIYDAMNGSKIVIIFINFKTLEGQSEFLTRQQAAMSSFLSSIYFFMGEKSLYDEQFGDESQECDFNFNIDENDQRDEIDASVLEIRSVLSSQNFDMHENTHFLGEDLSIGSFMRHLELSQNQIENYFEKIKEFLENFDDKLEKEMTKELLMNLTRGNDEENYKKFKTTPKMMRKIKIFMKKLSKLQNLVTKKLPNYSKRDLLNFSLPIDENIRSGSKRNFVKILQEMFKTSNAEIYKSKSFIKLLREQKVSIPLACDVKC